jgi:hypothetical protein
MFGRGGGDGGVVPARHRSIEPADAGGGPWPARGRGAPFEFGPMLVPLIGLALLARVPFFAGEYCRTSSSRS